MFYRKKNKVNIINRLLKVVQSCEHYRLKINLPEIVHQSYDSICKRTPSSRWFRRVYP